MNKFKRYEKASEQVLPENMPIVARIDGSNFLKLTDEHFEKPFDAEFESLMNSAAKGVLEYCTEAKLAYIHSDEISTVIRPSHEPFLAGRTQKLASLLAAKATAAFTAEFGKPASFDCRVFVMPKWEVVDYFEWRQEAAWTNCLHSTCFYELAEQASKNFAHERLEEADNSEKQEILFHEFGINANDIPTHRKRGRCVLQEEVETPVEEWFDDKEKYERLLKKGYITKGETVKRNELRLDNDIPLFSQNRRYIDYAIEDPIPPVA